VRAKRPNGVDVVRGTENGGIAMKFFLASLSALFVLSVAPAYAGDGSLDQSSLSRMGLAGMKTLSDHDGMAIRGQFAIAYSSSFNTKGTTYTIINNPIGQHFAISATVSVGGGLFSGGFASASSR
jgi:hypothetical protein